MPHLEPVDPARARDALASVAPRLTKLIRSVGPGMVHPIAVERVGLLAYLAQQRHLMRVAVHGLTEEQARATPSASTLSLGGLIKPQSLTEPPASRQSRRCPQKCHARTEIDRWSGDASGRGR